ncbi:hypothetical protein NFI96_020193 [Prochilodus magdalenae]|nr:hypothetical protein NFI96_020193 [Prochilodus magdalenae]
MAPFRNGFSLEEEPSARGDRKLQAKLENAEVLELTVKQVENILQHQSHEADTVSHEASERFAAGYIQCMHEVHTFVSTCPGIDTAVAAELLNHLLECMPLHEESLPEALLDLMADQSMTSAILSPTRASDVAPAALSPTSFSSSSPSSEDLCSDLEETDGESAPAEEERPTITFSTSMWRPW